MTIPEAFALALERHQAGRLAEAEGLYRQILAAQSNHPEAQHYLGVIAHQIGRNDLAVSWIQRSVVLDPNNAAAFSNLGVAYRALGQLDEAMAAFRRAVELVPDFAGAHLNLGVVLRDQGRTEESIAACQRALAIKPDYAEARHNLGNALKDRGELDAAIAAFRRALQIKADYPEANCSLGIALRERGQLDEAIAAYGRALESRPDFPEALLSLGTALGERGQLDEAIAAYHRALEIKPDYPAAHYNLGNALTERGRPDEAIAAYRRAIELSPGLVEAHNNLGAALRDRGRFDEALAAFRRALQLKPDHPESYNNLGIVLGQKGQVDEAVAAYRRALEISPESAEACNNLGKALKDRGELDEAISMFRRAVKLKPEDARMRSNFIYTLHFHPGWDARAIAEEHRRWSRQFSEPLRRFILRPTNDRSPDRRLRIGYVSADFRDHVIGRNLIPLFERHDRREFEILCYSGVTHSDHLTKEFRQHADQWRNTACLGDEALAEMIRRDGVDILLDLTQHVEGNRLPVFARKPAPVQVSFAGYPDSAGVEAIEYRISDRYLEENSADKGFETEERVSLIDSFWCYDSRGSEVAVNDLPAGKGGGVTFGCLCNFCKVSEPTLRLWVRVLREAKDSRIVISTPVGSQRERILEILEREGVERRRVEFEEYRPRREYLELYHRLDIVLDTFPYNGHTTSLDALWMGVPVVSMAGRTRVSRAGLSQLSNLGLPELVAHSEAEYVNIAVSLANDRARLAELRSTLRERMKSSVLMDAERFARQVEQAYREMWKEWVRGVME